MSGICARCTNCGSNHSAAFRGCPVFIKNKEIVGIKSLNRISFAQAAKKYKEMNEQESTRVTTIKEVQGDTAGFLVEGSHQEMGSTEIPGTGKNLLFTSSTTSASINHPRVLESLNINPERPIINKCGISQTTSTPIQVPATNNIPFKLHSNPNSHCELFSNDTQNKDTHYNLNLPSDFPLLIGNQEERTKFPLIEKLIGVFFEIIRLLVPAEFIIEKLTSIFNNLKENLAAGTQPRSFL